MSDRSLQARRAMIERQIRARGITDESILEAFMQVPREDFVPPRVRLPSAYGDHPLPIGGGQTISQPFIVALMIDLLHVSAGDTVLEVGAGSGYQAALLAAMGVRVVALELLEDLARRAGRSLEKVGLRNSVHLLVADGYDGWSPGAPYQGIVVAAAPAEVPPALTGQLEEGGRLVLPVGRVFQELVVIRRTGSGLVRTPVEPVRFVPLVRRD